MKVLENIINLFYPSLCISCFSELLPEETILCIICQHDLPFSQIDNPKKNIIISRFYGRIPIEKASSFLRYTKHGITQKIIQELKYKGNQKIGAFLGNWYAQELKNQQFFQNIDYIVPVPLHEKKLKNRGYNQLTKFGETLSSISGVPYIPNILQRIIDAKTQTFKNRSQRFSNIKTHFLLTDKNIFKNKHILLIDDVITTGATLEMCSEELLKTENIKISIIALTSRELD